MSQPIAHGRQPGNAVIKLVRLGQQALAIDPRPAAAGEHGRDLVQGESGRAAKTDERQLLEHPLREETAKAAPADRADQALLLVIAQRRGGQAATLRDLGNIQNRHA